MRKPSRTEESFSKVRNYAKALGLTIFIRPCTPLDDFQGTYDWESKKIIIARRAKHSATDIIITILHELGHHLDFVDKDRVESEELKRVLIKRDCGHQLTKAERKLIYLDECAAADYMPIIFKELGLKIPLYKVQAEAALDKWIAKTYYETGSEPKLGVIKEQRKELIREYRYPDEA